MRAVWVVVLLCGCAQLLGLSHVEPPVDAPPMVEAIDAPSCWPFLATNYQPCDADFPGSIPSDNATLINTDGLPSYGDNLVLLHYGDLTVEMGSTLTIQGTRPVIIVADGDINILGTILVSTTTVPSSDCAPVTTGTTATNTSPGGGGGSYGDLGGSGGSSSGGGGAPLGGINGSSQIVNLRGGCPGGHSSDARGGLDMLVISGVAGGKAGGGLELSSKTAIMIAGLVAANGQGGSAGRASLNGGCPNGNNNNCSSGGGGGASGGAILLESLQVNVAATGAVCAVGGGGGAGGNSNGMAGTNGVSSVDCTVGGGGGGAGIAGGPGGGTPTAGVAGTNVLGFASGGGGGGSAGRVRIVAHGGSPGLLGVVVPTPVTH